ncbi:Imm49 family immunity protein [Streptomyces decoyicus]
MSSTARHGSAPTPAARWRTYGCSAWWWPGDILALACHARRRCWRIQVESPYLPQRLLRAADPQRPASSQWRLSSSDREPAVPGRDGPILGAPSESLGSALGVAEIIAAAARGA